MPDELLCLITELNSQLDKQWVWMATEVAIHTLTAFTACDFLLQLLLDVELSEAEASLWLPVVDAANL